ncbi:MAG: helix-turn-helix transcriptional regulator [Armatimonadetes bacterium]|nr:helix-turn-helix transcriptional regulator [Armatimonadota bacterium]
MAHDADFLIQFGKRIRSLRKRKSWSQEDLGLECDLDQTYISGIERGKRNVSLQNIRALAQALEVTLSELFDNLN